MSSLIDSFEPWFHIGESENPTKAEAFVIAVKAGVRNRVPSTTPEGIAFNMRQVARELVNSSGDSRWRDEQWLVDMIVMATDLWVAEFQVLGFTGK